MANRLHAQHLKEGGFNAAECPRRDGLRKLGCTDLGEVCIKLALDDAEVLEHGATASIERRKPIPDALLRYIIRPHSNCCGRSSASCYGDWAVAADATARGARSALGAVAAMNNTGVVTTLGTASTLGNLDNYLGNVPGLGGFGASLRCTANACCSGILHLYSFSTRWTPTCGLLIESDVYVVQAAVRRAQHVRLVRCQVHEAGRNGTNRGLASFLLRRGSPRGSHRRSP
mmetsp:Transcript_7047/g.21999  ORF Transcript_7047/g.21999 Transcript_7047/m.21999 type:complete len:230 (+) Transcript_7047:218-907(+)